MFLTHVDLRVEMLYDLKTELANLYPSTDSARRVVADAQIPHTRIDFDGSMAEVWHRIVYEAEQQESVLALVQAALREYPQNKLLGNVEYALSYQGRNPDGAASARGDEHRSEGTKLVRPLGPTQPMSERWGAFEDTARLRERVSVIETNMTRIDRHLTQLSEGQAENRRYTETKFAEITTLIKASPILPKPQNDRVFVAIMAIGALVTVIFLLIIAYWFYVLTGGRLT